MKTGGGDVVLDGGSRASRTEDGRKDRSDRVCESMMRDS